jgi:hypothetical protein
MRYLPFLISASICTIPLHAQSPALPTVEAHPEIENSTPREIAIDNLLSERGSQKALDAVINVAKKNGVSDQAILEARFLYHVDRREDAKIAAMLPEFLKQNETFKIGDSQIFSVKDDWLAVIEYVKAIAAIKNGDNNAFKSHITEAFWLSPRQASAFAPQIERMRLEEAMKTVKIDFTTHLRPLLPSDPVSLEKLMDGKKAMLIQFWSPKNRECKDTIPDFIITAKYLENKGIAVISLLPDDSPDLLTSARKFILSLGPKPPGSWLLDSKEKPFSTLLHLKSMPLFVLVSKEGKVLFNGDPTDDIFWDTLTKMDTSIVRPESQNHQD